MKWSKGMVRNDQNKWDKVILTYERNYCVFVIVQQSLITKTHSTQSIAKNNDLNVVKIMMQMWNKVTYMSEQKYLTRILGALSLTQCKIIGLNSVNMNFIKVLSFSILSIWFSFIFNWERIQE